MPQEVILKVDNGIAEIRFNRPEVLNAIDHATAVQFHDAVQRATSDAAVRVIVLAGEGRAFVAGGDLAFFRQSKSAADAAHGILVAMHAAIETLATCSQPVLASLKGPVAGGGVGVALAADIAIAADDIKFVMAYINIGTTPDCSSTWSLGRIVGFRNAIAMMLLGETIGADDALRLGLVNKIVPRAELEAETQRLASRLAAGPPLALARTKRLLRGAAVASLSDQLRAEQESFIACAESADFKEGLDAFFGKRKPVFTGG